MTGSAPFYCGAMGGKKERDLWRVCILGFVGSCTKLAAKVEEPMCATYI